MVRFGVRSAGLLVLAVLLSVGGGVGTGGCGGPSNKKLGVDSPVMPFEEPEDDDFIEDEDDDDDDDDDDVEAAEPAAPAAAPAPAAAATPAKPVPAKAGSKTP